MSKREKRSSKRAAKAPKNIPIPHNCETICKNYGKIVRASKAVEGVFEVGQPISICQICVGHDHIRT